jgi:G6PDH family F420-dependent oxidoreductase
MMPGRFFLGVGSGENLNEHVTGERWPEVAVRQEMMEEAVEIIRTLWQGGYQSYHGLFYTVENARIYTLPDPLPEIYVAAGGPGTAELAGEIGDGLICTSPDEKVIAAFNEGGGTDKPKVAQMTVSWATDEKAARRTAKHYWANGAIRGAASQELPLPAHFEALAESLTEDQVAESVVCGPDPERHVEKIDAFANAGFTHVYVHQVGPDQQGFIDFYKREILPRYHVIHRYRR